MPVQFVELGLVAVNEAVDGRAVEVMEGDDHVGHAEEDGEEGAGGGPLSVWGIEAVMWGELLGDLVAEGVGGGEDWLDQGAVDGGSTGGEVVGPHEGAIVLHCGPVTVGCCG